MSLAVGSSNSDCELPKAIQQPRPLNSDTRLNDQAAIPEPTFGSGIERGPWPCWKSGCLDSFTYRSSGTIGQEILNAEGIVIAWTTDAWLAHVIVTLLESANRDGLLR
jgi:hypothetical protein